MSQLALSVPSWEAYCGDFICIAMCQQKGGPLLLLAPLPVCLSRSLAFSLQTPTALLLIIPAAPLATSKWPVLQLQNDKEPEKHFSSSLSLPHSESEYTVSCSARGKRRKNNKGRQYTAAILITRQSFYRCFQL